jgi:hypothetical protein
MSTDFTHLSKLSFDQLFARKGPDQEIQVMDANGNLAINGLVLTPSSSALTVTGAIGLDSTQNNKLSVYNGTAYVPVDPVISVKEYGAKGDGSTDDTTAIQTAVTAIGTRGGGTLYFPKGTYLISSTISLVSKIRILGESKSSTIFSCSGHTIGATAAYPYFYATDKSDIIFSHIQINGNGSWTSTPFANPYSAGNSVGFTNENVGIQLTATVTGSARFEISDCDFRGLEFPLVFGANASGVRMDNFIVRNNYFYNIGYVAALCYGLRTFTIQHNHFQKIDGNMTAAGNTSTASSDKGVGIQIQQCTEGVVDGNIFTDLQDGGIVVEPGATGVSNQDLVISNNLMHDFQVNRGVEQQSAIYIGDGGTIDPIVVSGNNIYNIPGRGITGESCNIVGGSIYNCDTGIIPAPATTCIIDGVDLRNNRLGVYLLDSDTVDGNPVIVRNSLFVNNTQCGIYTASTTRYEITNCLFQDNGTGVTPSTHSGAFVDQWSGNNSGITALFAGDDCLIKGNTFISSANKTDTTGQLTGISVFSSGNSQKQNILDNLFIFTGTLDAYPTCLAATPCAFQTWFYNGSDYTRTSYELFSNGNRSTKTSFTNTSTIEGAAGFPRLMGYASAAPGSGSYLQGDYFINSAVSSGAPYVFMCVTSGTPGTWESWGGPNVSLAAVGSSPNANGASLSGQTLNLQPASASFPGVVSTASQTFAGAKTFANNISMNTNTMTFDADGTGAQHTEIVQGTSTNFFSLSANSVTGNGGELYLYGPNHATVPQKIRFANNGAFTGEIDINGKWVIGPTGGSTQTHSVKGGLTATGALAGSNLSGSNTGDQTITLTSDVTGSGTDHSLQQSQPMQ